ncbi:MAG TPA: tyrosine-type recombinase/integrase [Terriglobales bacterium]|nr:tyrosine-type recombinase/integrase [Terriglobales bacterium]
MLKKYTDLAQLGHECHIRQGMNTGADDGELVKRFGFHTFRHSLRSWLMANDENPQIVCAMLRWKNLNMLSHYTHGFKADKLEAQGAVLEKLVRESNRELESASKTATAAMIERYGRHVGTRTPDLYRVNLA